MGCLLLSLTCSTCTRLLLKESGSCVATKSALLHLLERLLLLLRLLLALLKQLILTAAVTLRKSEQAE